MKLLKVMWLLVKLWCSSNVDDAFRDGWAALLLSERCSSIGTMRWAFMPRFSLGSRVTIFAPTKMKRLFSTFYSFSAWRLHKRLCSTMYYSLEWKFVKHLTWKALVPKAKPTNKQKLSCDLHIHTHIYINIYVPCFFRRNGTSVTSCLRDCLRSLLEAKRCYSGHKFLALNGRKNTWMGAKSLKKSQWKATEERFIAWNKWETSIAMM